MLGLLHKRGIIWHLASIPFHMPQYLYVCIIFTVAMKIYLFLNDACVLYTFVYEFVFYDNYVNS